jgi:hypothetical protein
MNDFPLTGGCNCGGVRFEVTEPLVVASYCLVLRRLRLVVVRPQSKSRRSDRHPDGAFHGDPGIRPSVRQFVAYAAPWEPIADDGLPRYPGSRHTLS